jgi:hypothetical protein
VPDLYANYCFVLARGVRQSEPDVERKRERDEARDQQDQDREHEAELHRHAALLAAPSRTECCGDHSASKLTGEPLANVVPDNGVVVLSLHYQSGLRASPTRRSARRADGGIASR